MTKPHNTSARVGRILRTASGSLANSLAHAERLQRLDAIMAKHLSPDIIGHCRAGNQRGNTLVIHASSPAWAAKLRFLAPQLLRALQHENGLSRLQRIEVRIQPENRPVDPAPGKAATISDASRQHLQAMATTVSDPRLRDALKRLAKS
ncbi:MAG: DUF721 domain-containing protein [Granulosicoccaceae bacterium]|jgi:hypothetical protein